MPKWCGKCPPGSFDRGIVPGVEVAWRLAFREWGCGYATEAARAVIEQGFSVLGLSEIIGVASESHVRSRGVMTRLRRIHSASDTFEHSLLPEGDVLRTHRRVPFEKRAVSVVR